LQVRDLWIASHCHLGRESDRTSPEPAEYWHELARLEDEGAFEHASYRGTQFWGAHYLPICFA